MDCGYIATSSDINKLATSKKKKNRAVVKNRLKFKILTLLILGIINISKANFHKFKIEVKKEGKEIIDYEIYFQNQDEIFVPNWNNKNEFGFNGIPLNSKTEIIIQYRNREYRINKIPIEILQSAKIIVEFGNNKESNKKVNTEDFFFTSFKGCEISLSKYGKVFYADFCFQNNERQSKKPLKAKKKKRRLFKKKRNL